MGQIEHAEEPVGSGPLPDGRPRRVEREEPAEVRRPWLVAVLAAAALSTSGMAVGGLSGMASALDEQPVTLAAEADLLEAALQEAPWTERGGEGPVVWAVAPLRCERCAPFFERDLPALREQGLRVRLILIAPRSGAVRPESAGAPKVVRIRHGGPPIFAAQYPVGASAGDEDWARASLDRITAILAANGASMEMPCLLWRRGFEWRAAFARPGRSADYALQELAPEA